VAFRLTPKLRAAAVRLATREGLSLSELAREALAARLAFADAEAESTRAPRGQRDAARATAPKSKSSGLSLKSKGSNPPGKTKPSASGGKRSKPSGSKR
jgi:hypothetical protein